MSGWLPAAAGMLLTLAVHSTLALAAAWGLQRAGWLRDGRIAELVWRAALLGPVCAMLVSAALLVAGPTSAPASVPFAASASAPLSQRSALKPTQGISATERTERATRSPAFVANAGTRIPTPVASRQPAPTVTPSMPASPFTSTALALPAGVLTSLVAIWGALLLAAALRLAAHWRALARLRHQAAQHASEIDPAARTLARDVAAGLGIRPPSVRMLESLASPMVLDHRSVLLPSWFEPLDADQRRALLAHEFAHLQRDDLGWRMLIRLACLPLAFQPLAALAVRRLDALSETACDAASARLLGSGRPLAECLAACAASHRSTPSAYATPQLALAMAERPGSVLNRARHLLQEPLMPLPFSPSIRRSVLAVAIAVCIALPALHVIARESNSHGSSINVSNKGGRQVVTAHIRSDALELEVAARGKIEFADDESDVVAMDAGARLEIEETRDGIERSIRFTHEDGAVVRDYRMGGSRAAFDDAARAWLAETLPAVFRLTAMDAEGRAGRILARGGAAALLDEIAKIEHDHARRRYLEAFFAQAQPTAEQATRAMQLAQAMASDFERRRAGQAALRLEPLPPLLQREILQLAAAIGSDFERAELLIDGTEQIALDDTSIDAWQLALHRFGSAFETRRVLTALADSGQPTAAATDFALATSTRLDSAFERRSLLEHLAERAADTPHRAAYLASAAGVDSDFERRTALIALIDAAPLDDAGAVALVEAMKGMGSDFERRTVLEHLAAKATLGRDGRRAYLQAAAELGSDFEQRSALTRLIQRDDLDAAAAADLLGALDKLQSDFERRSVLVALANTMPADPALIDQYRSIARGLGTHDRGLAEAALDRFASR